MLHSTSKYQYMAPNAMMKHRVLLEKLIVTHLMKNPPPSRNQKTGLYPEPVKSSPHGHTLCD
jgi:hypothetical protein